MAILVLRRFRPEPDPLLRRFGPDGRVAALAARQPAEALPVAVAVGPIGPPGVPDLTLPAGAALSALRAVRIAADGTVLAADKDSAPEVCGLSLTSAALAASIEVRLAGPVVDPSWNWAEGPVWLGSAGALTQIAPTTGHLVIVGRSAGATRLIVAPEFIATLT